MPLHPDDVVRKTFRTTSLRRGYDETEVDAFLEEVVAELRRLRRQVDEQQVEIDRTHREAPAQRLAVEEQQLEQVRRERDALAAEMRDADRLIAQAQEDVARAEADRDAELEVIRVRFDEDLSVLKKRAHETREEARRLAEEARLQEESLVARLALIRSEVEEAVAAELGEERVSALIGGLQLVVDTGPLADLGVIAALAEAMRGEHVQRGLAVAQEIRAEAEAERDQMIADATSRSKALLDVARQQHDELLESAQAEHDRLIADAHRSHDENARRAPEDSDRMVAEPAGNGTASSPT
jgi:DivIVA domain-containing protein